VAIRVHSSVDFVQREGWMRAPFARLFVHLVWATWDRLPLITPDIQPRIYQ
jgi:hypothetical protein